MSGQRSLGVLGSPIAHSKSPLLHEAAYGVLGLDWSYGRHQVDEVGLPAFFAGLGPEWRGVSLTMPLKVAVLPLLDELDEVAKISGGANTVVLGAVRRGWNTDVPGIVRAFADRGVNSPGHAVVLGTGATARSALMALREVGTAKVTLSGRSIERVRETAAFASNLGLTVTVHDGGLGWARWPSDADLVVSTLPGGTGLSLPQPAPGVALFDVAYADSDLPELWRAADPHARIVSGLDMLVEQALLQVRIFVTEDPSTPLPDEERVLAAMDAAVGRTRDR